jgi:predicted Rossmann fold nucleotide-binding protein DprA/Smf involved in DNA uptake
MRAATFALEQDRPLFACDWKRSDRLSEGPRRLIKQGAHPVSPDRLDDVVSLLQNPEKLQQIQQGNITGEQMQLF